MQSEKNTSALEIEYKVISAKQLLFEGASLVSSLFDGLLAGAKNRFSNGSSLQTSDRNPGHKLALASKNLVTNPTNYS